MRPALVVTAIPLGPLPGLFWALMITGAGNRGWEGDYVVPDYRACGLPIPCVIRTAKVAVFETRMGTRLGRLDEATMALIDGALAAQLLPRH